MSIIAAFGSADDKSESRVSIADALETNHIVFFPKCPIPLPSPSELQFLRADLPSHLKRKNISYHPEADTVTGFDGNDAARARVRAILKTHLDAVTTFLQSSIGYLTTGWTIGTCSFRPIEERGRNLKPHASNELVHIDAGAYGATDGDRILRFFVNVNDRDDRVWATKGPIEDIVGRFGRDAGLINADGRLAVRLTKGAGDRALSAAIGGLSRVNPLARVLDTSPYDRAMRRLHNFMKDANAFHADQRGYEEIRFPPMSAWMVFTDSVSHASLSGQFAFVTTAVVRREHMRRPEYAPFNVLARLKDDDVPRARTA